MSTPTNSCYIIRVREGSPEIIGPYESAEERRRAYIEKTEAGEQVFWLDVNGPGTPYVGKHWGWR